MKTKHVVFLALLVAIPTLSHGFAAEPTRRPNVVLIITDDQGYGDLGFHGNPIIKTPNLDRLARESVQFDRFYVSPVCSPTRASLMTGRYNYRTRVVDTFVGRSMMDPGEVTLAEMLGAAGYRTGIFGKWHLGDNYPMRAIDQGFQEALVIKGGGIGQSSDPPDGQSYFDPVLQHNGKPEKVRGYCSDIFTDAAIRFVADHRADPFFVYLAFNCPHDPLEVPEEDYRPYASMDLGHDRFPTLGHPLPGRANQDSIARVYGMVTNIDRNLGRLFAKLDSLGIANDTIVVFLTDNGPSQPRYNAGMLDRKATAHEGGIRVPCFVRWPGVLKAGRVVDRIAAHIDLAPTLLEACKVAKPPGVAFDGVSLLPLLKGEATDWPDRTLYFQWHRGDEPMLYRGFAARSQRYKLVQSKTNLGGNEAAPPQFELFDMAADPFESQDIAAAHPEIVARMKTGYETWLRDVGAAHGYAPPLIILGSTHENPSTLTRQDWRGPRSDLKKTEAEGHWEVEVARGGTYAIALDLMPRQTATTAHVRIGRVWLEKSVAAEATRCTFEPVALKAGPGRLEAWVAADGKTYGAWSVEVRRRDD